MSITHHPNTCQYIPPNVGEWNTPLSSDSPSSELIPPDAIIASGIRAFFKKIPSDFRTIPAKILTNTRSLPVFSPSLRGIVEIRHQIIVSLLEAFNVYLRKLLASNLMFFCANIDGFWSQKLDRIWLYLCNNNYNFQNAFAANRCPFSSRKNALFRGQFDNLWHDRFATVQPYFCDKFNTNLARIPTLFRVSSDAFPGEFRRRSDAIPTSAATLFIVISALVRWEFADFSSAVQTPVAMLFGKGGEA